MSDSGKAALRVLRASDGEAVTQSARIGLTLEDVLADWGLGPAEAELRDAVALLLTHGGITTTEESRDHQRLQFLTCGARIRAARHVTPDHPDRKPTGRIEAAGAATVFRLTPRQRAVLLELRWAALSTTFFEARGHLDQAALRLDECLWREVRA